MKTETQLAENNKCIIDKLENFYEKEADQMPIHVIPFGKFNRKFLYSTSKKCLVKIVERLKVNNEEFYFFPIQSEETDKSFYQIIKAKIIVFLKKNIVCLIFEDGAAVFLINDSENYVYKIGDELSFIDYKHNFHKGMRKSNPDGYCKKYQEIIYNFIKKVLGEDSYKIPYVMTMLFSKVELSKKIKACYLDPNLIIYSNDEDTATRLKRYNSLNPKILPYLKNMEYRGEYNSFFSWSLILIEKNFPFSVFIEYCFLEAQLQYNWYHIYSYSKDYLYSKKSFWRFDRRIQEINTFYDALNDISDVSDSERVYYLKERLIRSSKIKGIVEQAKLVIESRKNRFSIWLNKWGVILTGAAALISLVTLFISVFTN